MIWWRVARSRLSLCAAVWALQTAALGGQTTTGQAIPSRLTLETGKQVWDGGCVSCHGPNGAGESPHLLGFEPPDTFPDFSDCPTSTVESDIQWRAVITHGGPARGFSRIMPAFRDLLTPSQIDKVIVYMRDMCTEDAWPRGNLNLPRPLFTEKAFPENETVVAGSVNAQGDPGISSTLIYEKRIGASGMIEAIVPFDFTQQSGTWGSAFGDLGLGYKHKLVHSLSTGSIFSVGAELFAPTGNRALGTGGDSTVFEGFAAYGQFLSAGSFLQAHTGIELPAHPDKVPRAFFARTAIGKMFAANGGLGSRWTPIVEFIADRELVSGTTTNWDVVPQIQIPLNTRMHVLGNVGLRFPVNNTASRPRQLMFYVLWDWADGGLLQGW